MSTRASTIGNELETGDRVRDNQRNEANECLSENLLTKSSTWGKRFIWLVVGSKPLQRIVISMSTNCKKCTHRVIPDESQNCHSDTRTDTAVSTPLLRIFHLRFPCVCIDVLTESTG